MLCFRGCYLEVHITWSCGIYSYVIILVSILLLKVLTNTCVLGKYHHLCTLIYIASLGLNCDANCNFVLPLLVVCVCVCILLSPAYPGHHPVYSSAVRQCWYPGMVWYIHVHVPA